MRLSREAKAAIEFRKLMGRRAAARRRDKALLSKMAAQPPIGPRYPVKVIYRREPISND